MSGGLGMCLGFRVMFGALGLCLGGFRVMFGGV